MGLRFGIPAALLVVGLLAGTVRAHVAAPDGLNAQAVVGAPSYAESLDHLPIVVNDLPSADDSRAIAAYRRATVRHLDDLAVMYGTSFDGLEASGANDVAIAALRGELVEDPESVASRDGMPLIEAALRALDGDPRNADRLNNAAISAWLYGVTNAINSSEPYYWHLQQAAVTVLLATNRHFPAQRTILLNLAFLTTVVPGWEFAGAPYAEEALALDPADLTARALLASIQSRRADVTQGADQAVATLGPIVNDPAMAALGHALVGDAHLAAASIRRTEAPAASRHHAALALAAYDRALEVSADPGLHAGRARALERLDQLDAAVEAQARAVELAPGSLDLLVDLSRLRHRAGDVEGLRTSTAAALAVVVGGWDPSLEDVRFVTAPGDDPVPEDRGFLGWSVGSGTDHLPVAPRADLGSGAGVVVVATIPLEPPGIDHELVTRFAPRSAWQLAFAGAILAGDAEEATGLQATWDESTPWRAFYDDLVAAAHIVAQGRPTGTDARPFGLTAAETAFQRARQYSRAAELCRAFGDLRCAGENEYHAGNLAAALSDLKAAYEASLDSPNGPSPELRMLVAAAAEADGDLPTAEAFLAMTAGADDAGGWRPLAALRAGDLRLDAGDPSGAVAWYDLALATIEANELAEADDYSRLSRALEYRWLRQVARNNRAVALLRALQPDADTPPRCDVGPARDRCEAALADVLAASASDPANAVYRMNEGWIARLLGHADTARIALAEAVRLDAELYPAFNDLGILLAEAGDANGARQAFEAAIAAAPAYDLARWNLGILELRDMPGGILEGQVRLAEAIRLDPSLRTAPLAFRTDERTYRFGFEAPLTPTTGASLGRSFSLGAVVLAGVASVAALGQLQATVFGHGIRTAATSATGWLERQARQRHWRARRRTLRRRLPRPIGREWLPWVSVAILLMVVTGWQAVQASPAIAGSAILMALTATLIAVIAHAIGHLVAARRMRGRLVPAAWGPGALVAVLFLPFQAASGPFPAERIRLARGGDSGAWRFHLAGPLANAVVGLLAYGLFLVEPLPGLRLVAQVQLAAIAYALLPVQPLDGWALQRKQPRLLITMGFAVIAAGSAFALGLI